MCESVPESAAETQEPHTELSEAALRRLEAVRQGTEVLVHEGLTWLDWAWARLPEARDDLQNTGAILARDLKAPAPAEIAWLTVRGCRWYLDVRLLRADTTDPEVPPWEGDFRDGLARLLSLLDGLDLDAVESVQGTLPAHDSKTNTSA